MPRSFASAARAVLGAALLGLLPGTMPAQSTPPATMIVTPLIRGEAHGIDQIRFLTTSATGRIAISDGIRLYFFSAEGKAEGTFGRKGEGPGEFLSIVNPGWIGDTLWVNDVSRRNTTWIAPGPKLLRSAVWPLALKGAAVPADAALGATRNSRPYAIAATGEQLVQVARAVPAGSIPVGATTTFSNETYIVRARADGTAERVVAQAGRTCDAMTGSMAVHAFVCGGNGISYSPDGNLFATLRDGKAPSSATTATHLTLYDRTGRVIREQEIVRPIYRLSAGVRDSILKVFRGRKGAFGEDLGKEVEQSLSKDASITTIRAMHLGSDATIWLMLATPDGPLVQTIDAAGREGATIRPVDGVSVGMVGARAALGVTKDGDGLPTVVRITWR